MHMSSPLPVNIDTTVVKDARSAQKSKSGADLFSTKIVRSEDDIKRCFAAARELIVKGGNTAIEAAGLTREAVANYRKKSKFPHVTGMNMDHIQGLTPGKSYQELIVSLGLSAKKLLEQVQNHEEPNGRWVVYDVNISIDHRAETIADDSADVAKNREMAAAFGISAGKTGGVNPIFGADDPSVNVTATGDAKKTLDRVSVIFFEVVFVDLNNAPWVQRERGEILVETDASRQSKALTDAFIKNMSPVKADGDSVTIPKSDLDKLVSEAANKLVADAVAKAMAAKKQ